MFLNHSLDTFLTLQVKGTGCCSDKALSLNEQWLRPGTLDTGRNGLSLYPIPLAEDDNFLSL
jgi:hypothetical protein